MKRATTAIQ